MLARCVRPRDCWRCGAAGGPSRRWANGANWPPPNILRRLGYHIVARRHRTPLGEIDLVAVDGRTVVFVEVKTRRSHDAGQPHEAIDPAKQARLSRLALAYLKRHDLLDCQARFDVIAVTWQRGEAKPSIEHFLHAFESTL